jgi:hypothetical protein
MPCESRRSLYVLYVVLRRHTCHANLCLPGKNGLLYITSSHITKTLRLAVTLRGLSSLGFGPEQISVHSLRTGGAYALFVCGVSETALRMLGRWKSDSFMSYIRAQHLKTGQFTSLLNSADLKYKLVNPFSSRAGKRQRST